MAGALRVGLLVNPVAGLGGPGGFKGSDHGAWKKALEAGYAPTSPGRAARFVAAVGPDVAWVAPPGALGGETCPGAERVLANADFRLGSTTPEDTVRAAQALRDAKVDLLCFVGGDGTATDVARAVGESVPCLGVPAGVKITSPVFAHDVAEAAWLVGGLRPGFETVRRDVTDLDEEAYRQGHFEVRLRGSLMVPPSPAVQDGKVATAAETPLGPIVEQVLEQWDADALHLVGAGSVCLAVKSQFWGKPTLLGVDAIVGNRIVATDLDDRRIAELVREHQAERRPVRITLSPIGGQGMLLGRGTQVLRPEVLRSVGWDNLLVISPPEKLFGIRALHVDTGDPALDASAPRHIRVVTGWNEVRLVRIQHGPVPVEPETGGPARGAAR
ncbi:MAG TPA: NAD(+)/NADH kinase [Candidatus Thermoplasmatota archaeon]|nr:NAD(+)/NADH kinase [Candidatus Thermoplasmatota archaeon]